MAASTKVVSSSAVEVGTAIGSREILIIKNQAGSGGNVRVGTSDVTTSLGILLSAGDPPLTITGPAARRKWYAIRDDSADVTLDVVEMGL